MAVIIVEGDSDRVAVETIAGRLGLRVPVVVAVGGSKGAARAAAAHADERVIGLVDIAERRDFERVIKTVFVCDPDLEAEFIDALGVPAVVALIAGQGELASLRRLQRQPAQRSRTPEQQLARFFSGRSGNKLRYARLMAQAVPLEHAPPPIRALLRAAGDGDLTPPASNAAR
ncbi:MULTISPECIES: ATP-dependent endonuclease [unclassified Microbacterium]|uniref:ATP-dependent endonuclease n=1 Tax=unclassified Microbacterium TaxID=2609290 RepID=UPI00214B4BE8|nr:MULTISPECIES: ATP-dependent endonuclease [unclassified Microbacterium]MCR2810590.1 ATP-dependent endonuclease [Microbacterium sp. zg.B185]WIM18127.1 ATP-dependent endonuclease [Microbacterium sp. zg-B185]